MLHIIEGSRDKVLKESEKLLSTFLKKDPETNIERFEDDEFDIGRVKELCESQSLFGSKSVAVIDETEENKSELEEILLQLETSENAFVVRRTSVEKAGRPEFNIFSLTEALATRDKKQSWILYQKALASGLVPEQVFWKLTWQTKSLLLAAKTKTAQEAGMKPYPYSKAKQALSKWQVSELEDLSMHLVQGYCLARRGEGEIETLIEKTLLRL